MRNKFWYLTKYGLKKKLKSKSFIISNIIIFLLLIVTFNIDSIISFFGGSFEDKNKIYVIDDSNLFFDSFKTNYQNIKISLNDEDDDKIEIIKSDKERIELEEEIKDTTDIIIELKQVEDNYLEANVITENYIDTLEYQSIIQSINNTKYEVALKNSNIDLEELANISTPPNIERVILDETKNSEEENMNTVMNVVFPTIILPFFMLILLLVQLIGGEINEEKTTRSMEIIISNVPVKVHFYSKIIANNLFIILQTVLLFLYGVVGFLIRNMFSTGISSEITGGIKDVLSSLTKSGVMDKLYYILPCTIILMILSFLAYSLISGILASITTNPEDFQQIQTPIIMICMVSYMLATMSGVFNGSVFIKVLSYIPLISFLLAPSLLLIGQIGIIDIGISILLLILFNWVLTKYGLKIYKVGILNYSTDNIWKKLLKATKE